MKTKLIEITPEQALKILKENDMEPVDGFVFWDDEEPKYESKLSSVVFKKHVNVRPFGMIEETYWRHCARIVQIADGHNPDGLTPEQVGEEAQAVELQEWVEHYTIGICALIAEQGKASLLSALAKHGITAERAEQVKGSAE